MEIKNYTEEDETMLFEVIRSEGKDWECYFGETAINKYKQALKNSIAYVACEGKVVCGYARCRNDDGFGIYVYDLLVQKEYRGHSVGRKLLERVCVDYPDTAVYVMSGVDGYYEKLGYHREGSIFAVKSSSR